MNSMPHTCHPPPLPGQQTVADPAELPPAVGCPASPFRPFLAQPCCPFILLGQTLFGWALLLCWGVRNRGASECKSGHAADTLCLDPDSPLLHASPPPARECRTALPVESRDCVPEGGSSESLHLPVPKFPSGSFGLPASCQRSGLLSGASECSPLALGNECFAPT